MRLTLRQSLTSPVRPTDAARAEVVMVAVPDDTPDCDQLAVRLTETLEGYGLLRPQFVSAIYQVAGLRSVYCVPDAEWQGNPTGVTIIVGDEIFAMNLAQYDHLLRTITNLVRAAIAAHRWQARPTVRATT